MTNLVLLTGRLTADPKVTHNESTRAIFTLAVENDFKNRDGKRDAEFISCTAWRRNAEFIEQYLKKGTLVNISGHLHYHHWKDDKGDHSMLQVIIDRVWIVQSSKRSASSETAAESDSRDYKPSTSAAYDEDDDDDGEDGYTVPSDTPESYDEYDENEDDLPF